MSFDDTDLIERLHAVARGFEMPAAPAADDVRRGRRRVRRNRGLLVGAAAAVVTVVLVVTAAVGGHNRAGGLQPAQPPGIVVGDVPVWYDAQGLHRGDVVEQTLVDIVAPVEDVGGLVSGGGGALALVRSGALYLDPATGDIWFHPWGGHPHIVGHHSTAGPGGDPNGDTAAWFDGGELVVYDTAAGREISRTLESAGVNQTSGDHNPPGNTFLQVSAERVVWTSQRDTYSHDRRTQTTSVIEAPQPGYVLDVQDQVEVDVEQQLESSRVVLRVPGRAEQPYPDLEPRARLSASGNYVLAVEGTDTRHAAAIVDTRTGELWPVPKNKYPWIAWSYGDIALVDTADALLACDAAHRTCQSLPATRPFLMPTN